MDASDRRLRMPPAMTTLTWAALVIGVMSLRLFAPDTPLPIPAPPVSLAKPIFAPLSSIGFEHQ